MKLIVYEVLSKTITDADYIAILANTPNQAETLLHSLERAIAGIGLYVNAHKTEYMCYNQTGDISTLDGTPLKLVDKFTYLGSSISSTERDIDTRLTKAWTAINRLSIIWKSDLTDKMKRNFFQAAVTLILLYGCTTWRSRGELISDVLLWTPTYGWAKAGRPAWTYIQQLCEDTGCSPEDLPEAMNDRKKWRERIRDIRAISTTWWWWLVTWNHTTVCKLFVLDGNTWYHITMCKNPQNLSNNYTKNVNINSIP